MLLSNPLYIETIIDRSTFIAVLAIVIFAGSIIICTLRKPLIKQSTAIIIMLLSFTIFGFSMLATGGMVYYQHVLNTTVNTKDVSGHDQANYFFECIDEYDNNPTDDTPSENAKMCFTGSTYQ